MAAWVLQQTLGGDVTAGPSGRTCPWLTDSMYLVHVAGGIYRVAKWTPNTLTDISIAGSFGANAIGASFSPGPVVFNGGIFVFADSGGLSTVYKYSGAGTIWSAVHAAGVQLYHIFMTDSHIVVLGLDYVAYSSDGTSWIVGSMTAGDSTETVLTDFSGLNHSLGNFATRQSRDNANEALALSFKEQLLEWNGAGTMVEIGLRHCTRPNTSSSYTCGGDLWVQNYIRSDVLHWYQPSAGNWSWSTVLDGTYTTPANDSIFPVYSHNMLRSVGYDGLVVLHLLEDDGEWDAGETVDTLAAGSSISFVTMDPITGNAYLVTRTGTTNVKIYARDTPYPVSEGGNRLWVYKSVDGGLNWTSRGVST